MAFPVPRRWRIFWTFVVSVVPYDCFHHVTTVVVVVVVARTNVVLVVVLAVMVAVVGSKGVGQE